MRRIASELLGLVLLALIAGTSYIGATGRLEFFVAASRYPQALVCSRTDKATNPRAELPAESGREEEPAIVRDGTAPPPPQPPPVRDQAQDRNELTSVRRFSFAETVEAWRAGVLFVDARKPQAYAAGHIPGAVSIPAWEPGIEAKLERLAADGLLTGSVVVYCTRDEDCEDSEIVARQFLLAGFPDISIYGGGFDEWSAAKGMPAAAGEEPGDRGAHDTSAPEEASR